MWLAYGTQPKSKIGLLLMVYGSLCRGGGLFDTGTSVRLHGWSRSDSPKRVSGRHRTARWRHQLTGFFILGKSLAGSPVFENTERALAAGLPCTVPSWRLVIVYMNLRSWMYY